MILLPNYVRLGNSGTALRLIKDDNVYYRDGGAWKVSFRLDAKTEHLFSVFPRVRAVHNKRLYPTTYKYWTESNGEYVDDFRRCCPKCNGTGVIK